MVRLFLYLFEFLVAFLFAKTMRRLLLQVFGKSPARYRNQARGPQPENSQSPRSGEMVRDPVCGMFVSTELSQRLQQGTQTLHFCSRECLERYQKEIAHAAS